MIKKLGLIVIVLLGIFYWLFFVRANVASEYSLKLDHDYTYEDVEAKLKGNEVFKNNYVLDIVSMIYKFDKVPAGHYKIRESMSSFDILKKLKHGQQDPVRWTISTATFVEELAGKASEKFSFDSSSFLKQLFDSTTMRSLGYTRETALTLFLPNTYEFYWNTSPKSVLDKMHHEVDKFWTAERKAKAMKIKLSHKEVYILASLVQKEYTRKDERSKIASVLLNRLRIYMPLQVDATCKYATGDFTAKRVNYYHTQFKSPYNTYNLLGLPPGPICMPELSTIDAVLDPETTDYIYYCADPSLNGYHVFSKTLAEHESIATTYHQKMNQMKIK